MDLCLPGSAAVRGPGAVSGLEQGSLALECRYDPGWETYMKWWCRGAAWHYCEILVKTSGSEPEVKNDRVSIRNHQKDRTFTVTMEELRLDNSDTYWCGIERVGIDLGAQVTVNIYPGASMCVCGWVSAGPVLSWCPVISCHRGEGLWGCA
ncbi:CMRF35-like molecule 5 [Galemys pyrenaicus]|uniref:CMRF35-like molecule 5 n=1 Tax=Galemys pyrenaicus TaxID=202257 RepID=A0A8J6DJK3_GALPY|nr:CMRF35-like molecule 5 [Galemys pyrenaicus]